MFRQPRVDLSRWVGDRIGCMGSKKARERQISSAAPAPAGTGGPPWLIIAIVVAALAAGWLFMASQEPDPAVSQALDTGLGGDGNRSVPGTAATVSDAQPVPADTSAPTARQSNIQEFPTELEGLPMPPLPYVPQMVPRPPDLVRRAYVFAAQNPGVLGYVPCYCGCENDGHVSNVDCFVGSRAPTGAVASWDTHGMT